MAVEAVGGGVHSAQREDDRPAIVVKLSHRIDDVAALWSRLGAGAIESPGQSLAFTRTWIDAHRVAPVDQYYLTAEVSGQAVALLPLRRRHVRGVRMLSWFPGEHVGCNAPLVDADYLVGAGSGGRAALWSAMLKALGGADLIYLKAVPQTFVDGTDLFAELGTSIEAETLYRAQFASWEEANTTQRSKSRRKHDRQQGERLEALGQVTFEELRAGEQSRAILDTMFRQRAARFVAMGVKDPFAHPDTRRFYEATLDPGAGVDVRFHLLRLNGEVVAIRYNIAHEDRLFCLISSMSDDASIQTGSPGKQCLLRVMQTVFNAGYRMFDMGAGFTDEKRHWCNVHIPVRHHYIPLTPVGATAARAHLGWQALRQRIKANKWLMGAVKAVRGWLLKTKPQSGPVEQDG